MKPPFDSPQWTFQKTKTKDLYAGLKGRIDVLPAKGKMYRVSVEIPTDFFKFAREVLGIEAFDSDDCFVLEQDGKRWYLSFEYGEDYIDLWYYTKSNLPPWVK